MTRLLDTTAPVTLEPVPATTVVEGSPQAGARPLAEVVGTEVGVWELTAGTVTDVEVDEVFVVLSGSATVSFEDGEVIDLGPGVTVHLRAGDRTTWTVHEVLRKVYVAGA
ncbi:MULTISPECIES: cupin domain-containing protein [unclassified Phycicoccus]|uniref:cupin domain-containing protein n=1 Tax=unclassified Phycicoccus TaxID=2637926 RepID=UPI0007035A2E|nr:MULTISPECIES: cupin domain-containing protein [unclassified Phycicoccus]KQU68854.1 cupin [Phycicoccus sp. Root101]KQZ88347.1 cupin [Phycicoccus sp. Root563]